MEEPIRPISYLLQRYVLNQAFHIPEIATQRAEETAILAAVHQNVGRGGGIGLGNQFLPAIRGRG